jgi:agmatinase
MHEPWNALDAPRFTGPRTFARLPHIASLDGAHAAVFGMPWDGGTSFRSGARFGPEAVRSASGMIRTYNPVQRVQVFGELSTVDFGDARTVPGYVEDTLARIEDFVRPIAEAGVVPLGIGGDHSVTLAELRAIAGVQGQLGLLHFDSHTDLWDSYNGRPYSHGTMFRRAIEEGLIDPARTLQVGMRGPLYGADDEGIPDALGVETIPWHELAAWTPAELAERARDRLAGRPAFLTLDVDFVDPAYCPGTGRRSDVVRGAPVAPRVRGAAVRRLRRRRGGAGLRRAGPGHRAVRRQRAFRDVVVRRAGPSRAARGLSATIQRAAAASASTSAKISERIRRFSSANCGLPMSSSERGRAMSTCTTSFTRPGRRLMTNTVSPR